MKKIALSLIAGSLLFAGNNSFNGYSYVIFGAGNFNYSEKFIYTFNSAYTADSGKKYLPGQSVAVKSNIQVTSPMYFSGGIVKFNDNWDLSMDFASTLKPNQTTEDWKDRGDDSVIVSNYATIMTNSARFLLHYKLTNQHRLTFGVHYVLNTFKRYNDPDAETTHLVEETSASVMADLGYWFESSTASQEGFRIKYSITGGYPVYQDVTNTAAPNLTFSNKKGYNVDTSFYIGYTLFKGLELGLYTGYSYMYRDGGTKYYKGQKVIWPTNITQIFSGGLQITWNFN